MVEILPEFQTCSNRRNALNVERGRNKKVDLEKSGLVLLRTITVLTVLVANCSHRLKSEPTPGEAGLPHETATLHLKSVQDGSIWCHLNFNLNQLAC